MARTVAELPKGNRITDFISLGVVAKTFPMETVKSVLAATGKESIRQRDLPAHVVVYYVIALALYMQSSYREVLRCLLEGVQWLLNPSVRIRVTGKSGISQARTRLGFEAVQRLHDEVVRPIATAATRGAWYKRWRLVSLDGSTLDVADEEDNERAFGRQPSWRGTTAYPQVCFVSLVENGTHVLFGTRMGNIPRVGAGTGGRNVRVSERRDALPGRPQFLSICLVEQSPGHRGRSFVESQEEPSSSP